MGCLVHNKIKYQGVEAQIFYSVYKPIVEQLENSKLFRSNKKGLYLSKFDNKKVKEGISLINSINKQYGTRILGYDSKRRVKINVNPIAQAKIAEYHQSTQNYVIDEEGDIKIPDDITRDKVFDRLTPLMIKLGIRVGVFDEYKREYQARTGNVLADDVSAFVDILNRVVVAKNGSTEVLNEELVHFFTLTMASDFRYKRALELVVETDLYREIHDTYFDRYKDENMVRKEVLDRLILDQIKDGVKPNSRLGGVIQRLWERFLSLFTNELDNNIKSIVKDLLDANIDPNVQSTDQFFFHIDAEKYKNSKILNSYKKQLEEGIDKTILRTKTAFFKGKLVNAKEIEERLTKLDRAIHNDKITYGVIELINYIHEDINAVLKKYERMYDRALTSQPNVVAKHLKDLNSLASAYNGIISSIQAELSRYDGEHYKEIKEELNTIQNTINIINTRYEQDVKSIFANFILPVFKDHEQLKDLQGPEILGKIIEMLERGKDINWFHRIVSAMANIPNDILGAVAKTVNLLKVGDRAKNINRRTRLLILAEELQKKGINGYDWLVEKLDGEVTGNFITDRNYAQFDRVKEKFGKSLIEKYGLPEDGKERRLLFNGSARAYREWKKNDYVESLLLARFGAMGFQDEASQIEEEMRYITKKYRQDWAKWLGDNQEDHPDAAKRIKEHLVKLYREEFNEVDDKVINFILRKIKGYEKLFGQIPEENIVLTPDQNYIKTLFGNWLDLNRGFSEYREMTTGDPWYLKGELVRPNSKYLNPQFAEIQKDPLKKEYYDHVMQLKEELDYDISNTELHRLPQIHKDHIERLRGKGLSAIKEEMQDWLRKRSDDTEFGGEFVILDENNRKYDTLPLNYIRKIDTKDLSLDITRSMLLYAEMAQNYSTMKDIVDILEVGEDILNKRKIEGKPGWEAKFREITGTPQKEVIKEGGNVAERYHDFLQMHVFGKMRKPGEDIKIFGLKFNTAKLIDSFNKYVTFKGLALNLSAGIANPLISNFLIRQEAFAKQHVTHADILAADKFFLKHGAGYFGSIGSLTTDNKLRLFAEKFDMIQDYTSRLHDLKTDRDRYMRLLNTSRFFFMNQLGELQVSTRMGTAILHNIKVDHNGTQIPLIDAYEVRDKQLVLKEGVNIDENAVYLKIQKVNRDLFGNFSDLDRAAIKQWALGRAAMVFRSWMPSGFTRRFVGEHFDFSTGHMTEGMYVTMWKFLGGLIKEMRQGNYHMIAYYDQLPDWKRANILRNITGIGQFMFMFIAAGILEALAEGEDDDYKLNLLALQANRLHSELSFYTNPNEFMRIMKAPSAGVQQVQNIIDMGKSLDLYGFIYNDDPLLREYQSGKHVGEKYLWVRGRKLIPPIDQIERWFEPEETLKYYTQ